MEYRKYGDTYVVRMDRGEEILEQLTRLCEKEDIRLASVEAIGAAEHAVLGIYDLKTKVYTKKEWNEIMEISSLMGSVTRMDGKVYLHLHATLCDHELRTLGGHVNELRVGVTCEMFVRALPGEVGRRSDSETGINLFQFD